MQRANLRSYAIEYITIPSRPDIDRMIVISDNMILINKTAKPGANVAYLVFDRHDKVPRFELFSPVEAAQAKKNMQEAQK